MSSSSYDFIRTSDSCYVFAGTDFSTGGDGDYSITKINRTGDTLWHRKGNLYNTLCCVSWVNVIKETSNGNYLIGAVYYPTPIGRIYMLMYDSTGNLVWEKTYASLQGTLQVYGIVELQNTFLLSCAVSDSILRNFLMKIDENGDSLWSSNYLNYPISGFPESITELNKNRIYVTGTEQDSITLKYQPILNTIDSNGIVLQSISISDSASVSGQKIYILDDSSLIIVGRYMNSNDFKILKLNSFGDQIWQKILPAISSTISIGFKQKDLIIIGGGDAINIWRLDSLGITTFQDSIYLPENIVEIADLAISEDNKVLINGYYTNGMGGDAYIPFLIQLSDTNTLSVTFIAKENILEIFPVPLESNQTLNLKFNSYLSSDYAVVKIIDSLGRLFYDNSLKVYDENLIMISLVGLNKGNYFVVLNVDNKIYFKKIIVI